MDNRDLCKTFRDDVGIVPYDGNLHFVGQGLAPAAHIGVMPNKKLFIIHYSLFINIGFPVDGRGRSVSVRDGSD